MKCYDLFRAVRYGNTEAVKYLLKTSALINAKNNLGKTPLHIACQTQRYKDFKSLSYLILIHQLNYNRFEIAQMLTDLGADVNIGDNRGDDPIHIACKVSWFSRT